MSLLLSTPGVTAEAPDPAWQSLDFRQQALWVTAQSTLRLDDCSEDSAAHWCLTATSSVGDNSESIAIEAAADGTLLQRERASVGRERRRIKRWHYGEDAIKRQRLEPDSNRGGDYGITSERLLAYPGDAVRVSDPVMLLLLAAPDAGEAGVDREFVVHTDFNFYTVTVTGAGRESLAVDFQLDGQARSGEREVVLVRLDARPVEPLADKPDFSLQGLSGTIVVAYDADTGIPLQLRGRAPRLGQAELNLVAATRRPVQP